MTDAVNKQEPDRKADIKKHNAGWESKRGGKEAVKESEEALQRYTQNTKRLTKKGWRQGCKTGMEGGGKKWDLSKHTRREAGKH